MKAKHVAIAAGLAIGGGAAFAEEVALRAMCGSDE